MLAVAFIELENSEPSIKADNQGKLIVLLVVGVVLWQHVLHEVCKVLSVVVVYPSGRRSGSTIENFCP